MFFFYLYTNNYVIDEACHFASIDEVLQDFFIIVWNIASELVSLKNITASLNDPFSVVNAAFHLSSSFIHTLLYPHHRSIFVNTFFVLIFYTMSKIKGKG